MLCEPPLEIRGHADVSPIQKRLALQQIDVMHTGSPPRRGLSCSTAKHVQILQMQEALLRQPPSSENGFRWLASRSSRQPARLRTSCFGGQPSLASRAKVGGRTRTRTLDPLIKSQLLYQLSYAPGLPRRKTAERAWLSKGARVSPAETILRSFPHRRKNSDSAIIALTPAFAGTSGGRKKKSRRCLAGGFQPSLAK